MIIILLGAQGSGKGTQAELLSKEFNLSIVETGSLFRKEANHQSEQGRIIRQKLKKGELISDDLTIDILKNKLTKIDTKNGFILDGFPRNLNQAKFLDQFKNKIVVYIDIPDEEVIKRLSQRKICSSCGKIYIGKKNLDSCSLCQGKIIRRDDDRPEAIAKRLELFKNQTKPLLDYYRKQGILVEIDGRPSIDKVFVSILNKLKGI
jgi:adenylate kinase